MNEKRAYRSQLREDQARQTRDRIVEALIAQLYDTGRSDFAMNEIAERAGVSVRTVYRHFPTRGDLFDAVREHVDRQASPSPLESMDQVGEHLDQLFRWWEENPEFITASHVSELGREGRAHARRRRSAALREGIDAWFPHLSEAERRRAWAVFRTVFNSQAWRTLRFELDLDPEQARDALQWVLRLMMDDLRRREAREGEER